jgi:hypothetical protein
MTKTLTFFLAGAGFLFIAISVMVYQANLASASAPIGLPATVATTSNWGVGPQLANSIFATSTCSARIVTTRENPVRIVFSDVEGRIPTATVGHLQLSSTTVAYDSGIVGCGLMRIFGVYASSTITVTETR